MQKIPKNVSKAKVFGRKRALFSVQFMKSAYML